MVWCLLWTLLIYENPDDHPRISEDEKIYINSNTRTTTTMISLPRAPIMKILTSVPVLATIFTALGQNYGFYTILKMTPTYLNNIQHVSIRNVGTSTHVKYCKFNVYNSNESISHKCMIFFFIERFSICLATFVSVVVFNSMGMVCRFPDTFRKAKSAICQKAQQ